MACQPGLLTVERPSSAFSVSCGTKQG